MHNDRPKKTDDSSTDQSFPLDSRERYDYQSKYPRSVSFEIYIEVSFLVILVLIIFAMFYVTWNNQLASWINIPKEEFKAIKAFIYYPTAGMLGGVTFGMKFLYRAVARGYWHRDRRPWRILSPIISMIVAYMVGMLIESNFINETIRCTSSVISIGFLAGYFADEAVGKMYEVANVIFGKTKTTN